MFYTFTLAYYYYYYCYYYLAVDVVKTAALQHLPPVQCSERTPICAHSLHVTSFFIPTFPVFLPQGLESVGSLYGNSSF